MCWEWILEQLESLTRTLVYRPTCILAGYFEAGLVKEARWSCEVMAHAVVCFEGR